MDLDFLATQKLNSTISQIQQLLLSDFPHPSTEHALLAMQSFFEQYSARIQKAASNSSILSQTCVTLNERISEYLPVLGLLLRSTDVRNNFEAYDALKEIAKALIGPDAEVIMSSEWDYSPLTYAMSVPVLPKFVLLGMPASEGGNALILPLAGHELGHSVWTKEGLEATLQGTLQNLARDFLVNNRNNFVHAYPEHAGTPITHSELLKNIFLVHVVSDATRLALSQLEEAFCDAVGVHLFGVGFAFAFHYLLAPNVGATRSLRYPTLNDRAKYIEAYGGVDLPSISLSPFKDRFVDQSPRLAQRQQFVLQCADEIRDHEVQGIYEAAHNIVHSRAPQFLPSSDRTIAILERFQAHVPSNEPGTLADVLNAGWEYVRLHGSSHDNARRPLFEWISELVLKSIEVLEYQRRTQRV